MTTALSSSPPDPRFRWRRTTTLAMRPAAISEATLTAHHVERSWILAQGLLGRAQHHFVVSVDVEIGALLGLSRGSFCPDHISGGEQWTAQEALSSFESTAQGKWALCCGLWIDSRHLVRLSDSRRSHFLRLAGPLGSALFARRHGLVGVLSAVALHHLDQFSPALSPRAYLQQVHAGAIDDPLLAAHLRHGARPLAIVEDTNPCFAILQWRRL